MSFIGRETELSILEQQYGRPGGQLFVVYGRRRVGKTALLNRFCMGKPHVYFTASQSATRDNLHQFAAICQRFLNRPEMQTVEFKTIEGLLQYLNGCAGPEKLVIVLDEYQYWAGGDPSLGSLIQRFWDHSGKQSNVMLVLCGSYISLMVDYALAERSPLYGRRSGQLHVLPFDYRTAARFFPQWSYKDRLMAYGILGGIPAYLEQFDSSMSLPQNILENLLAKGTFLNEEATFLLKTELRDTRMYTSILRAIAAGNTSLKDLASKLGMEGRALSPYLSNLQGLHHVRREVSLSERAPDKSRKGRYVINDHFLNFWFRFVDPVVTLVDVGRGEQLFRELISPQVGAYMGGIFESVCQDFVLLYGQEIGLPIAKRVGRIWDRDYDIDVVSENLDSSYTFGECKWSSFRSLQTARRKLLENSQRSGMSSATSRYVLFSTDPVTIPEPLQKEQPLFGVSTDQLFA